MKDKNQVLIGNTVQSLTDLVIASVKYQTTVSPIFKELADKLLNILKSDEEINDMETKDLIKLLEVANKAQIQPVTELTKLVQSVTALHERSALQNKIDKLQAVVNTLKSGQQIEIDTGNETEAEYFESDEVEEFDEDDSPVDIDSFLN